jgi:hypothetical protein
VEPAWDIYLAIGESEAQDPRKDVPRFIVLVMYVELRGATPPPLTKNEALAGRSSRL